MKHGGATSAGMGFAESRLAAARAGFVEFRHVEVTGSTNTDLVVEAREGKIAQVLLVADHQSAGRGRLDRRWLDAPGTLLVSFRFAAGPDTAHLVVAAVAAAARGVAERIMAEPVLVKWPNDLVLMRGDVTLKLAGVLAEVVDGAAPVVVVGLGLNIAAVDTAVPSASFGSVARSTSRDRVLAGIIEALPPRLDDPGMVRRETIAKSATIGRRVAAELPGGERLVGQATGLDSDGRLMLTCDDGSSHVVSAGDVIHLRPADPAS